MPTDGLADQYVLGRLIGGAIVLAVVIAVALGSANWSDLLAPWRDDDEPPADPRDRVPYRRPKPCTCGAGPSPTIHRRGCAKLGD